MSSKRGTTLHATYLKLKLFGEDYFLHQVKVLDEVCGATKIHHNLNMTGNSVKTLVEMDGEMRELDFAIQDSEIELIDLMEVTDQDRWILHVVFSDPNFGLGSVQDREDFIELAKGFTSATFSYVGDSPFPEELAERLRGDGHTVRSYEGGDARVHMGVGKKESEFTLPNSAGERIYGTLDNNLRPKSCSERITVGGTGYILSTSKLLISPQNAIQSRPESDKGKKEAMRYALAAICLSQSERKIAWRLARHSLRDGNLLNLIADIKSPTDRDEAIMHCRGRLLFGRTDEQRTEDRGISLPKRSSKSALDVMQYLSDQTLATIWPDYQYSRISDVVEDDDDIFEPHSDMMKESAGRGFRLRGISINPKKMNVHLDVVQFGFVNLNPRQARRMGMVPRHPTKQHRRFCVIKGGELNLPRLKVGDLTTDQVTELRTTYGVKCDYVSEGLVLITLPERTTPAWWESTDGSSPGIDDGRDTSEIDYLGSKVARLSEAMMDSAVCLHLLHQRGSITQSPFNKIWGRDPYKGHHFRILNKSQLSVLLDHGVNERNNYIGMTRKVTEKVEGSRSTFKVYLKGFSTSPNIKSIMTRVPAKKTESLKSTAGLVRETLSEYSPLSSAKLNLRLANAKHAIRKLKLEIGTICLRKCVAHEWWTGLQDDEHQTYEWVHIDRDLVPEKLKGLKELCLIIKHVEEG